MTIADFPFHPSAADDDIVDAIEPRPRASHIWPRNTSDWYIEPKWCSSRLFQVEPFVGAIHDPACGMGRIVEAARAHDLEATGGDIADRGFNFTVQDFALVTAPIANVVVNPPFGTARQFVEHALELTAHKIAALFPVARLNAARWLADTPLRRIWLLTPRPSMPPGEVIMRGEKPSGGKTDFAWLVFEQGFKGEPVIGWLHRDGSAQDARSARAEADNFQWSRKAAAP
jgi:predicted RNA methylase